ncbi:unnamed protein product [Ectocarpus sp. CCAP 1310/34]|nr:unnamed protein product [Ectocarpus sp. CCAP 1310/34]
MVGWRLGAIQQFLGSVEPKELGSTRRQTNLSRPLQLLASVGMHFKENYVAVTGGEGGVCPPWGGSKHADIGEPRERGEPRPDNFQKSTRDDRPASPESERGEFSADGMIEGELGVPRKSSSVVGVEGDDWMETEEQNE